MWRQVATDGKENKSKNHTYHALATKNIYQWSKLAPESTKDISSENNKKKIMVVSATQLMNEEGGHDKAGRGFPIQLALAKNCEGNIIFLADIYLNEGLEVINILDQVEVFVAFSL